MSAKCTSEKKNKGTKVQEELGQFGQREQSVSKKRCRKETWEKLEIGEKRTYEEEVKEIKEH